MSSTQEAFNTYEKDSSIRKSVHEVVGSFAKASTEIPKGRMNRTKCILRYLNKIIERLVPKARFYGQKEGPPSVS
jgi:hypothetical protein